MSISQDVMIKDIEALLSLAKSGRLSEYKVTCSRVLDIWVAGTLEGPDESIYGTDVTITLHIGSAPK